MSSIKLFKISQFKFFIFISFLIPKLSFAAACCGGGFSAPLVITNDDKAMLTTSYSYSKIDTDVFANGLWQKRSGQDSLNIFKIDAAHIWEDRYQYGFSIPIQSRDKSGTQGGQTSGLGDVTGQVGYEYLPDWDYNPWRPHGVGFINLTLPTGKSIYESEDTNGLDSRGRGFWAIGLGTALTKSWTIWDLNSTFEVHKSFQKKVSTSQIEGTIDPGLGGNILVGSGYNINNLRLGAAISWSYEDAISVTGTNSSRGSIQRFSTGIFSTSYLFENSWASTLSYSDQTLFGQPVNTSLSKTVALSLQKRWSR